MRRSTYRACELINPWDGTHSRMDGWMDGRTHSNIQFRPEYPVAVVRVDPELKPIWWDGGPMCVPCEANIRFAHGWLPRGLVGWMDGWTDGWRFVCLLHLLSIHLHWKSITLNYYFPCQKKFFCEIFIYFLLFFNDQKKLGNFWN
jgi:hypothetical protein